MYVYIEVRRVVTRARNEVGSELMSGKEREGLKRVGPDVSVVF